ncbi:hypothetical protein ATJ88_2112 [Isoptericola jiangsuensis]|uniref:Uncharacterized protein n=1 Tax=Isoptericola jiangsuensis TaxID=548579 RepID=A0A2A9EYW9_9MICO|nr:DUF5701 family protein [Isoptericola jiangsuensis]PFG43415.1 hypothetical protein ATJ88_2112 [Isoptericola jiangsuensis]
MAETSLRTDPTTTASAPPDLPPLTDQAERLVDLGLVPTDPADGTLDAATLRRRAADLTGSGAPGALLVVHPRHLPPSALAPHLLRTVRTRGGEVERPGFVVEDMTDVDAFAPVPDLDLPDADVWAVLAPDRGDDLANASPEEAVVALAARSRTPLTLGEGAQWVLQSPGVLEPGRCFMTIGSRVRRADGSDDARTPALWISGGTGRDGAGRRGAAKIGWCWWRNRHTWLGFASAAARRA